MDMQSALKQIFGAGLKQGGFVIWASFRELYQVILQAALLSHPLERAPSLPFDY